MAPVADGVLNELLSHMSTNNITLLGEILFNRLWRESKIPLRWKSANVIPLNKGKGDLSVEGFRPIALCSA